MFDTDAGFQGFNLFVYCGNNPVGRIDVSGTDSSKIDEGDITDDEFKTYGSGGTGGSLCGGVWTPLKNSLRDAANGLQIASGTHSSFQIAKPPVSQPSINPLENIQYTKKVQQQMQQSDFHGFPNIVDNYGGYGYQQTIIGGDQNAYTELSIPGSYLGYDGSFVYIWNEAGYCNHRKFEVTKR